MAAGTSAPGLWPSDPCGATSAWHVRAARHDQARRSGHLPADARLWSLRRRGLGDGGMQGLSGASHSWFFGEMAGKHGSGRDLGSPPGAPLGSRLGSGFPGTSCRGMLPTHGHLGPFRQHPNGSKQHLSAAGCGAGLGDHETGSREPHREGRGVPQPRGVPGP